MLKPGFEGVFFLITHEKTVATTFRMSDTLQIIFKRIFIFDLNHESLEVNIMGNNSLLFIKLFEESIAKSVKCCMKSLWWARIIPAALTIRCRAGISLNG